jgi:hypothetical protein
MAPTTAFLVKKAEPKPVKKVMRKSKSIAPKKFEAPKNMQNRRAVASRTSSVYD